MVWNEELPTTVQHPALYFSDCLLPYQCALHGHAGANQKTIIAPLRPFVLGGQAQTHALYPVPHPVYSPKSDLLLWGQVYQQRSRAVDVFADGNLRKRNYSGFLCYGPQHLQHERICVSVARLRQPEQ